MSSSAASADGQQSWLPAIVALLVGASISSVVLYFFAPRKPAPALDPTSWLSFPLVSNTPVSPNTAIYRLRLPSPKSVLGLPIGQHISIQAPSPHGQKDKDGKAKTIQRSYTPISSDEDLGVLDLMIKTYPTGNVSLHFDQLKVGDAVQIKGPKGQMRYKPNWCTHLAMIAGGTGITPMLQIIRASLGNPLDLTLVSLIYANVNPDDILLRDELDELAAKHSTRFRVYYVLNNPPTGWEGGVGFVSREMIAEHLPHPTKSEDGRKRDVKTLMCGPPPMIAAMKKHLDDLGYEKPKPISKMEDQVFVF